MLLWLPKTKRESAVAIFAEKSAYSITTHSNLAIRSYHFFSRDIAQFDLIAKTEKWKSLESHSLQSIAPTQFPPTTLWLFSCCHFLFPVTFCDLTQVLKVTNKRAWSRNHCWRCGFLNHHTAISAYFITFQKNMHAAWVFFDKKVSFLLCVLHLWICQDCKMEELRNYACNNINLKMYVSLRQYHHQRYHKKWQECQMIRDSRRNLCIIWSSSTVYSTHL